jgi:hypothetical protein
MEPYTPGYCDKYGRARGVSRVTDQQEFPIRVDRVDYLKVVSRPGSGMSCVEVLNQGCDTVNLIQAPSMSRTRWIGADAVVSTPLNWGKPIGKRPFLANPHAVGS